MLGGSTDRRAVLPSPYLPLPHAGERGIVQGEPPCAPTPSPTECSLHDTF